MKKKTKSTISWLKVIAEAVLVLLILIGIGRGIWTFVCHFVR
jgi:hypothetical protein